MSERMRRWRRWTDGPLLVLAVGSLPLLLLELERTQLTTSDQRLLDIVNVTVLVAFLSTTPSSSRWQLITPHTSVMNG